MKYEVAKDAVSDLAMVSNPRTDLVKAEAMHLAKDLAVDLAETSAKMYL